MRIFLFFTRCIIGIRIKYYRLKGVYLRARAAALKEQLDDLDK